MRKYIPILFFFFCLALSAQQTDYVDFKNGDVEIEIYPISKYIKGCVTYTFDITRDTDSIDIDAKDMTLITVLLNQAKVNHHYDDKRIKISQLFKESKNNELVICYKTLPKKAMYFVGWDNDAPNQVWTQGQGKYTSNWLPSINDMNDKIEFDLTITIDKDYEVIANGKLINEQIKESTTAWHYDMQNPMSSYLVAIVIGKYNKKVETSKSGISLEMYYYPEDSNKVEPTYRYTKEIFDYMEDEIGFPYPWQNYKQVPVHDFMYSGMENTGTTIFADTFVIDSTAFVDRNFVTVNAHEMAHQWFGNLVTETSGTHHWLQEGFATYYALLAERKLFGDTHYYWKLYESANQLYQQDLSGHGTSLLNPNSSSLTFYERGAWVLHALRDKVGDRAFRKAVVSYLRKHQFKNVETNDFIKEVEQSSEQDLRDFVKFWIENKSFPYDKALESLKQSVFIQEYLMVDCEALNSRCDYYLDSTISDQAKSKIISQVPDRITPDVFRNSLKVRQAIAESLTEIPLKLKKDYESLLKDKSYKTIETALYNLWLNFPEESSKYLNQTKDIIGFNDYNVRLLWLVLHLNTFEYQTDKKQEIYSELVNYTNPQFNVEVRIKAFQYLEMLKLCNENCQKNLKQATSHHNWRMSKFAREMLEKI
ncbi:M1 family metallopeptidase [Yeosuana sp. MJ-SS3]|uniref:Aminopeptidase N n=1 Tax=Gilvirhabdus luticola TaxID=3079858 RepID=A0ABU3U8X8_9FLAO|nr:M1 family metallopeptidase [Yeosuana sp. MJ-SS3]MDU8886868.1 M1 family metallopeptidase [Yeosuana sp. MJ-SS3]